MSEENPWKKLSSRTAYENPWMRVREDQVICPDGTRGIYGVLETKVATGVVALTPDNQVYLVGQFRYATDRYSWEIVEGAAEPGETPLQGAQRELREEAGLIAADWLPLAGPIWLSNCLSTEQSFIFLARDLSQVEASPEGSEVLKVKTVPFAECMALIDRGEIHDAVTIIGMMRAEKLLNGKY